jgi:DNA-binding LacI/PurR family transcriptional regulator
MAVSFPYREKAQGIAADLRARIIDGEFGQGDRLPTRQALRDVYSVTSDTVQRALDCLMAEGFVESAGRRGTFVSMAPPHLTNYALLFPNRFLPKAPTNRFYYAMYREANRVSQSRNLQICDGFTGRAGFLEYESLLEDVRQNRLAGLVFASAPNALQGTPLLADDGVPRTAFMTGHYPHVPGVTIDYARFAEMAAERFVAAGRRRVAVLVNAGMNGQVVEIAMCRPGLSRP